jgi:DNA repair protein RadD
MSATPAPVQWRPYQRRAVNAAVLALKAGQAALLVLPTGSGKSLMAADAVCRAHVAGKRSLIICPSRELVRQDADAVDLIARRELTVSLACAGLGPVKVDGHVVIGTPQTLVRRLEPLGRIDVLVIDEAHRLGRKASGQIFKTLTELRTRNPELMVLGLTATPFRLDSGRLTEGPDRVFETVAFEVSYLDLVAEDYLSPLVGPRAAIEQLNVRGLRLVGGDYSARDMSRFDRGDLTDRIAGQIVAQGAGRKSWLVFAVSVEHAEHLAAALVARGIDARVLVGTTPKRKRANLVARFKAAKIRCLVGCDVFSTGFDAPAVDMIAVVRPTASPVWHVQSAGRGTRVASGKKDCLVLDFAGNFARLGPIDAPHIRAKGERARDSVDKSLTRTCSHCNALIATGEKSCPVCNTVVVKSSGERRTDKVSPRAAVHTVITGSGLLPVLDVRYAPHRKPGRPDSLRLEYRVAGFQFPTVSEWLCAWHHGPAGAQAREQWHRRLKSDSPYQIPIDAAAAAAVAPARLRLPSHVRIVREGEFTRVVPVHSNIREAVA